MNAFVDPVVVYDACNALSSANHLDGMPCLGADTIIDEATDCPVIETFMMSSFLFKDTQDVSEVVCVDGHECVAPAMTSLGSLVMNQIAESAVSQTEGPFAIAADMKSTGAVVGSAATVVIETAEVGAFHGESGFRSVDSLEYMCAHPMACESKHSCYGGCTNEVMHWSGSVSNTKFAPHRDEQGKHVMAKKVCGREKVSVVESLPTQEQVKCHERAARVARRIKVEDCSGESLVCTCEMTFNAADAAESGTLLDSTAYMGVSSAGTVAQFIRCQVNSLLCLMQIVCNKCVRGLVACVQRMCCILHKVRVKGIQR